MDTLIRKKPGRKPLPPEERETRRNASREKAAVKWKNITVEAETLKLLLARIDKLEKELGFRPSISHALSYLLRKKLL